MTHRKQENDPRTFIKQLVREHQAEIISKLSNKIKDASLAEDAFQEALFKALKLWQTDLPENPKAWLYQTAKNTAIDHFRKQKIQQDKTIQVSFHFDQLLDANGHNDECFLIPDQELKLMFTCCHPALSFENQVALTLQVICGFSTKQIATTFLSPQKTIEQRLVRSKKKIKVAAIPYQVPNANEIDERLNAVLKVIYLIFNQGYYSQYNQQMTQHRLLKQAIRLGHLIIDLIPKHAESIGLLSLMYFHNARLPARSGDSFIDLQSQDRSQWNKDEIELANSLFKQAIKLKSLGAFQIQAAISGVHNEAKSFDTTDWLQISQLYEKLLNFQSDVIININYAVSLTYAGHAQTALVILNQMNNNPIIASYLPYYVAKSHAFSALQQTKNAIKCLNQAINLSTNPTEHNYLNNKLNTLKTSNQTK